MVWRIKNWHKTMCDSTLTCYNSGIDTRDMPNKHLEHPEDSIFDGRRAALAALKEMVLCRKVSVKWDGAPAIVFGTNPENGKFFVGTKSVFNKKLVKINYTHEDIDKNHKGNVADILRLCLRHLPRISGIVQADWIGVGGGSVYTPNTVEYRFATPIAQKIILAPHTSYTEVSPTAEATVGVFRVLCPSLAVPTHCTSGGGGNRIDYIFSSGEAEVAPWASAILRRAGLATDHWVPLADFVGARLKLR